MDSGIIIESTWIGLECPVVSPAMVSPDVGCVRRGIDITMVITTLTSIQFYMHAMYVCTYLEWPGTKSHRTLISRRIILHVQNENMHRKMHGLK